jgi:diaminopimelate epimerase
MRFVKMQSVGNDYIVLDAFDPEVRAAIPAPDAIAHWARSACDRRFGIGADGILILEPPADPARADAHMTIVNADGSLGAMCANGLRAAAKLLLDRARITLAPDSAIRIAIHDRVIPLTITRTDAGAFAWAEADMGPPTLDPADIPINTDALDAPPRTGDPTLSAMGVRFVPVAFGNPHAVVLSDNPEADMRRLGPALEIHPAFPKRANIHFLRILAPDAASLFSWERGVGHTLACGSGACAAIVAANLLNVLGPDASMLVPGGVLRTRFDRARNRVYLSGIAATVFEADWSGPPLVYAPRIAQCPSVKLPLPTLRTDRLTLRAIDRSDAPAIRAMMSVREVAVGVASAPHPYPPGEEHRTLDRLLRAREERRGVVFAITTTASPELIGSIGLRFDSPTTAEIGYMLARPHWNRGYATEALVAILNYAFDDLALDVVFAGHFERNPASGRVLEKCGFTRAGEETCPCIGTQLVEHALRYDLPRQAHLTRANR